ncbi:hypothetical protein ACD591_20490 [Rufibacter glacialis]|uniref:Uncharacterized protein n=1 Tax=Rufibacter glacialis TaxID=1259555 RepID=A0A5M8QCU0_9BACT|nr:hypothetical protein [Rufibacter glacialis]KAA6432272.1 hypothetical protein FOE74_14260 [Rufibacter glacialis]GGK77305.1 hypothetical protein GCM10011405_26350 [Rufibacter glacialis]
MKYSFNTGLSRLELHDSSIEKLERVGTDVVIDFDWAKLADFAEMNLGPLILGTSRIVLKNVKSEKYTEEITEGIISEISIPDDFLAYFETIGENKSTSDNYIRISGVYTKLPDYSWINLEFEFKSFEFTWDNHVTNEEWLQGKLHE